MKRCHVLVVREDGMFPTRAAEMAKALGYRFFLCGAHVYYVDDRGGHHVTGLADTDLID